MIDTPVLVRETDLWALVLKPHGMPSAPLKQGEPDTLLSWFLENHQEAQVVIGKKSIEHGLIHRLDTGTAGLVLIAKTQLAYESLLKAQQNGLIRKTYIAHCSYDAGFSKKVDTFPFAVNSRFRAYGPGRREVRPVFADMRGFDDAGTDYETAIESAKRIDSQSFEMTCSLVKGYRHQIRVHLAFLGYPILGDTLYNPHWKDPSANLPAIPLQLFASGISFPDPSSGVQESFSFPLQDKTIL
jgi:23S rRNA pseudouridine1911/1915/1917 synthase